MPCNIRLDSHAFRTGKDSHSAVTLRIIHTLLLTSVLYVVMLYHSTDLVKHKRELGVVNTLLRSHNRKLVGYVVLSELRNRKAKKRS